MTSNGLMQESELKYQLHGLCLKSNIELTGLAIADNFKEPDIIFELRPTQNSAEIVLTPDLRTVAIPHAKGGWFVELYQLPSQYVMRFEESLDYYIKTDGSEIICRPYGDFTNDTVQQYLIGWVLSLVLHLKHMVGLHAGAIVVDDRAIGFVGSSGAGKSTLVTALAMTGYPVLTDEVLVFNQEGDRITAMPGYREIRLDSEAASGLMERYGCEQVPSRDSYDKIALQVDEKWADSYSTSPPLGSLYILTGDNHNESTEVVITPLDPKDAPRLLLRHSFVVPKYYRDYLNRQFDMLCRLCSVVPVYSLTFPKDIDRLPSVVSAVLEYESNIGRKKPGRATFATSAMAKVGD